MAYRVWCVLTHAAVVGVTFAAVGLGGLPVGITPLRFLKMQRVTI